MRGILKFIIVFVFFTGGAIGFLLWCRKKTKLKAMIDGQLFADLNDKLDVIDTIEGNPKRYYDDFMGVKRRLNKNTNTFK